MGKLRPFVRKDSYIPNKKWIPFVIGNGYTTTDGASGPAPEWETVTGNPVSFNAITPSPLRQLSVAFSPVQSGTGDPSPDNVRPISGWSSLTVEQRGVNLWNKANAANGYVDNADGVIKSSAPYKNTGFIPVNPNTQYYVKTDQTSAAWGAWYDADKQYIGGVTGYHTEPIITAPANAAYVNLTVRSGSTGNVDTFGLNYPATVTDFVPYNGRSISISLGSTVYSGTVDVVTGDGIADKKTYQFDGTENWTYESAYSAFQIYGLITDARSMTSNVPNAICSSYIEARRMNASAANGTFVLNSDAHTANRLYIKNLAYDASTKSEFAASLIGKTICYELAEPIPFHVDPQEVQSLAGDNTMWTDAASLEVTYRSN